MSKFHAFRHKWRINYPQQKTKLKKSEASDFAPAPDDNYSENNPK